MSRNSGIGLASSIKRLLVACLCLAQPDFALACFAKDSQSNPIASQYPGKSTGTINGTVTIIPIPYSEARSIIPSQYPILKNAYKQLMPGLGAGMYPVCPTDTHTLLHRSNG